MCSNGQSFTYLDRHHWLSNCSSSPAPQQNDKTDMQTILNQTPIEQTNMLQKSQKEVNLINLLEDFNISGRDDKRKQFSDLQMRELENFVKTSRNNNVQRSHILTQVQEEEFISFCDKYETKEKLDRINSKSDVIIDVCNTDKVNKSVNNLTQANLIGTPRRLVPKLIQTDNLEPNDVDQDFIEEILLPKNIDKQHRCNLNNVHNCSDGEINIDQNLFPSPSYIGKSNHIDKNNVMDKIIANNIINFISPKHGTENIYLNNNFIQKPKGYQNLNSNDKSNDLVTKYNIKYLETMKFDEKIFKKQSILKTDSKKLYLTPGPTMHEKAVVLPQIMERLINKKKATVERSDVTNKLVLDACSSNQKHKHNEEKLHYQSKSNQAAQVSMQKNENISIKLDNTSKIKNGPVIVEASGIKTREPTTSKNDVVEGSRFNSIEKLKTLKNIREIREAPGFIRIGPHILKPPEPLMTDCNKFKYVANATSHLFQDFVNGKR